MQNVSILGVTDPDGDPLAIQIDQILQDEPSNGLGDGDTCPDAEGIGTSTATLRAERSGTGNGRVYTIFFTASDGRGGSCQASVKVCIPHDNNDTCVDDGATFSSTDCSLGANKSRAQPLIAAKEKVVKRPVQRHRSR
jgi:hypothetical protein